MIITKGASDNHFFAMMGCRQMFLDLKGAANLKRLKNTALECRELFEWLTICETRLGVNFINILHTAFTHGGPKSVRTLSSCQYLFTLLGSASVKAVRRTLMKLSPDLQSVEAKEVLGQSVCL